ncbi:LysR family transcriptional regulator [Enterobacter adelaidei]
MELRHLRYFVALVEEKHFGKAAEKLHIVQPALSKQIQALEQVIGTTLIIRNSRRLSLTKAGELFYQEAVKTLRQVDSAIDLARRAGKGLIGVIRIGYVGNAALSGILSHYLHHYRLHYPDVEVNLQEMSPFEMRDAILSEQIDLAFATNFNNNPSEELTSVSLMSWDWVIGMEKNHPLAKSAIITREQLKDQSFVVYGDTINNSDQISILQRMLGTRPVIVYQVKNTIATLALTAAGYGLALLPCTLADIKMAGIAYRNISDFDERLTMNIFYRTGEVNPVVNAFVRIVSDTDISSFF